MYYLLCIISSILNILLRGAFFDHVMARNDRVKRYWFWIASCISALVLLSYSIISSGFYSTAKILLSLTFNISVTFILTAFYRTEAIFQKILFSLLYYSLSVVSEFMSAALLYTLIPNFSKTIGIAQDSYVMITSGLILCIIITLLGSLPFKKLNSLEHNHIYGASLRHLLLSFSTPLFSIIITLQFSHFHDLTGNDGNEKALLIFFTVILILNIVNFLLLKDLSRLSLIEEQLRMQKKQLDFQSANYEKISHSYKEGRRIIHEMKRFNNYILSCAKEKDYERIIDFINSNSAEIENRLLRVNTGNLVIDSLISNYDAALKDKDITFEINIGIDSGDIPLCDYDLCIILGNLLDNSFNATNSYINAREGTPNNRIIQLQIKTKQRFFVLHIENPCIQNSNIKKDSDQLIHGYGLLNVKEIVSKYNGIYFQETDNSIYKTTVSIPILRDSVGNIIRQPSSFENYSPSPPP